MALCDDHDTPDHDTPDQETPDQLTNSIRKLFEDFAQSTHSWRLGERCRRKLSISSGPCGVSTLSG